jgi:hypothetical protein
MDIQHLDTVQEEAETDELDLDTNDETETGEVQAPAVNSKKGKTETTGQNANLKNWEEIEFVIFTRDNYKPDPQGKEGTYMSTTTGTIPYPEVSRLYNERFHKMVSQEISDLQRDFRVPREKSWISTD